MELVMKNNSERKKRNSLSNREGEIHGTTKKTSWQNHEIISWHFMALVNSMFLKEKKKKKKKMKMKNLPLFLKEIRA